MNRTAAIKAGVGDRCLIGVWTGIISHVELFTAGHPGGRARDAPTARKGYSIFRAVRLRLRLVQTEGFAWPPPLPVAVRTRRTSAQ